MEQEIKSQLWRDVSGKFFYIYFHSMVSVSQQIIFVLIMHEKEKKIVNRYLLFKFECIGNNKTTLNLHMNNQFWLIKQWDKPNYYQLLELLSQGFHLFHFLWFFQSGIILLFFLILLLNKEFFQT